MKEEEQKRCKMLGRDRGKRGERNKGTKHVVLYLLGPFSGLHPKQGCRRVACKDLQTKKEQGQCQKICSSGVEGEWGRTCTTKPGAKHTSKGFERALAVPRGEKKKVLLACREGCWGERQRATSTIEVQEGG